jgi:hypothetical protein
LKLTGSYPNIWKFIEVIQSQESEYRSLIISVENETFSERRNAKDLLRDNKILELKNEYLREVIDKYTFIDRLAKYMPDCDKVKKLIGTFFLIFYIFILI